MGEFILNQMNLISSFGDNVLVILCVVIFLVSCLYKNNHERTAFVVAMTVLSYVYAVYLKSVFRISRPATADLSKFIGYDAYSFPSSHVVFYTVFWGFIVYLTFKYLKKANLAMHVLRVISLYFVLMIGISRVYLGAHYIRDVIGGYIFGGVFLLLLIWLDNKLEKDFSENKKNDRKRTKRRN